VRLLPSNVTCEEGAPMTTTLCLPGADELEKLSELPTELALPRATSFLARMVRDPAFLDTCIYPVLK
jgi:hypothetical protein